MGPSGSFITSHTPISPPHTHLVPQGVGHATADEGHDGAVGHGVPVAQRVTPLLQHRPADIPFHRALKSDRRQGGWDPPSPRPQQTRPLQRRCWSCPRVSEKACRKQGSAWAGAGIGQGRGKPGRGCLAGRPRGCMPARPRPACRSSCREQGRVVRRAGAESKEIEMGGKERQVDCGAHLLRRCM
jgi:hypothetical protein